MGFSSNEAEVSGNDKTGENLTQTGKGYPSRGDKGRKKQ